MMNVVRSFIAISLSSEITRQLEIVIDTLKAQLPGVPLRWAPAQNIHLTIKFLGDVSVSNLEMVKKIIQVEASHHSAFEMSVGNLGAFPTPQRPQVLWVGLEADQELFALQAGIVNEAARLGYPREERPFSPHLTLARTGRNASPEDIRRISSVIKASKVGFLGAQKVQEIHLYRSDLQRSGAVYTRLSSVRLQ